MRVDPTTIGHAVADQQAGADHVGAPAKLVRDPGGNPALPIEGPEQFPHIDDLRLELDDQDRGPLLMPGQHVDDASIGVEGKGHLGADDPPLEAGEPPDHELGKSCVVRTGHSVDISVPRPRQHLDPDLEGLADRANSSDGQLMKLAALDSRDRASRDAGEVCQVLLPPAPADPGGADDSAEPDVIHDASMLSAAHHWLIGLQSGLAKRTNVRYPWRPARPPAGERGQPNQALWTTRWAMSTGRREGGSKGPNGGSSVDGLAGPIHNM